LLHPDSQRERARRQPVGLARSERARGGRRRGRARRGRREVGDRREREEVEGSSMRRPAVIAGAVLAIAVHLAVLGGQQTPTAPVYTAAQAGEGRTAYEASCAACHRADLGG